jgi:Tfp pilus assembly PilM family ATPase
VVENGVREIASEARNSLDFHRSQEGGGVVSHIVLSGAAAQIVGFADALGLALGVDVRSEAIALAAGAGANGVSHHRLAVAAGLAVAEVSG